MFRIMMHDKLHVCRLGATVNMTVDFADAMEMYRDDFCICYEVFLYECVTCGS